MDKVWILMFHDIQNNASGIVSAYNDEDQCKREMERISKFKREKLLFAMYQVDVE